MKNTFMWTLIFIAACSCITLAVVFVAQLTSAGPQTEIGQTVSDMEKEEDAPEESEAPEDYQYILRDYNGRLAVFLRGSDEPEEVFDVLISTLPPYDQEMLKEGLKIRDYSTLTDRIEDYIS